MACRAADIGKVSCQPGQRGCPHRESLGVGSSVASVPSLRSMGKRMAAPGCPAVVITGVVISMRCPPALPPKMYPASSLKPWPVAAAHRASLGKGKARSQQTYLCSLPQFWHDGERILPLLVTLPTPEESAALKYAAHWASNTKQSLMLWKLLQSRTHSPLHNLA